MVTRWEKEQAMRLQQVVSDIGKLDEKKWQTQILSNLEEKLAKFSWSKTGIRWEGFSTVVDRTSPPLASVTEFVRSTELARAGFRRVRSLAKDAAKPSNKGDGSGPSGTQAPAAQRGPATAARPSRPSGNLAAPGPRSKSSSPAPPAKRP
jgi:hypothetical protein